MLIIRNEQMEVLKNKMILQFEDRMLNHLRSSYPEQTESSSDEDIRSMVQYGIEKALSYDVETEDDVQRFLVCMMIHGHEFDEDPETSWAGDILRRNDLNGTQKMNSIDFYVIFTLGGENG